MFVLTSAVLFFFLWGGRGHEASKTDLHGESFKCTHFHETESDILAIRQLYFE